MSVSWWWLLLVRVEEGVLCVVICLKFSAGSVNIYRGSTCAACGCADAGQKRPREREFWYE